jgi:hypothetical protein
MTRLHSAFPASHLAHIRRQWHDFWPDEAGKLIGLAPSSLIVTTSFCVSLSCTDLISEIYPDVRPPALLSFPFRQAMWRLCCSDEPNVGWSEDFCCQRCCCELASKRGQVSTDIPKSRGVLVRLVGRTQRGEEDARGIMVVEGRHKMRRTLRQT